MKTTQHAQELATQGKVSEAYSLLSSAAQHGDAGAALELAQWRMTGDFIRRDLGEARRLFGCAKNLGLQQAEAPYLALLANGAGSIGRRWTEALNRMRSRCEADHDLSLQLALIKQMNLDEHGNFQRKFSFERISMVPDIQKIPVFLSAEECEYIIEMAIPLQQPSVVVHPSTGAFVQDPIRTSTAAAFPFISENPFLHAINQRIAVATGTQYDQGEPLQVLSYTVGQEYKPHSDALPDFHNQRVKTVLVYLNEDFEGGETFFTKIGKAIRGQRGDAILFTNVDMQGKPDPAAIHAGRPVDNGRKFILSKWIREHPLDLTGPPDRPF